MKLSLHNKTLKHDTSKTKCIKSQRNWYNKVSSSSSIAPFFPSLLVIRKHYSPHRHHLRHNREPCHPVFLFLLQMILLLIVTDNANNFLYLLLTA